MTEGCTGKRDTGTVPESCTEHSAWELQVTDWTSDPKGARRAQWQPVATGITSRARYISRRYLLWMVFKVEIHVNRRADQKNYLIQYTLCQQTDVRSCKTLQVDDTDSQGTLRSQPPVGFQRERLHSSSKILGSALQNVLLLNHNIPHGLGLPKGQDLLLQLIFFITSKLGLRFTGLSEACYLWHPPKLRKHQSLAIFAAGFPI